MRRHLVIPDTQIRPGCDTRHIDWAAKAILDYLPDVIVVLGDWWDMHSLSTHDAAGSEDMEGANYMADIEAGCEAFARLVEPMRKEQARRIKGHLPRWNPECHFLTGNHENRISRAIQNEPKYAGALTLDHLNVQGFSTHPFLKIINIDGIKYCHFFPNPYSGRAIGGTITNRLAHIGSSFCQGHQQGYLYGSKQYPDHVKHGIVAGRFYLHHERYRPEDVQNAEWSGIFVLNDVRNGDFDMMPLSVRYLERKYG